MWTDSLPNQLYLCSAANWHAKSALSLLLVVACNTSVIALPNLGKVVLPSERYTVQHWTTQDGLPQNTVHHLLQDRNGYVWAGTADGLARFDGTSFRIYRQELLMSEPGTANVWDLHEDGDGWIWVRTPDGLVANHNGQWDRFPFDPKSVKIVSCSSASHRTGLWLGTREGLKKFENGHITKWLTSKQGLLSDNVVAVHEDLEGRVWIALEESGPLRKWQRVNPRTGKVELMGSVLGSEVDSPEDMFIDHSGRLWFWNLNEFIGWDETSGFRRLQHDSWKEHYRVQVSEGPRGTLSAWIQNSSSVFILHEDRWLALGKESGVLSRDLRAVLADREGGFWVGTGDSGLFRLQPRLFSTLLSSGLNESKREVFSVAEGGEGRLWFGTSDGLKLLHKAQLQAFKNNRTNAFGKVEHSLRAVVEDHAGTLWLGVKGGGLNWIKNGTYVHEPGADCRRTQDWTATALFEDSTSNLWIGSEWGLVRRSPGGQFSPVSHELNFSDQRISGIIESPNGSLWIGTLAAGLYHLEGGRANRVTELDGLTSNVTWPLCAESDGTLWIGTPKGLNRLKNGQVRAVTTAQGLFDDVAFCLLDDLEGYYWAACNGGIWRVRKSDLHAVADGRTNWLSCVHFGDEDGLPTTECNGECQPCAARAADGNLWFATTEGAVTVDPRRELRAEVLPTVLIEQVLVDNEIVFQAGSYNAGWARLTTGPVLHLPHGRARIVEVNYTSNSFRNPARIRFQDRLIGRSLFWRDTGSSRASFYTDLRPGNYQFEVRACDQHGLWSETPATFAFTVSPYLWQTWPFYVFCGFAVIGLAIGVQSYRLRIQQRILQLEHERALAQERARIARDLHDDLGTTLTGLALEMEITRRNVQDTGYLGQRLRTAADHIRSLASRMREVVWTVSPHCDNVPGLVSFLEQHAVPLAEAAGLSCRLDLPENLPELPLPSEIRHQVALSVREALTNVIRHAKATEVRLSLELEDGVVSVLIEDNGDGFDTTSLKIDGHGLSNLKNRISAVNGIVELTSKKGKGTKVTFRFPIRAASRNPV